MSRVLLLSGGMDSTAIAHWLEPEALLFIDYGQKPSAAEHRAADRVAIQVQRPLACLSVDCAPVGEDLLRGPDAPTKPTGEVWWPYRNQLLATFASAWALGNGCSEVLIGTVAGDGSVHRDGTTWFVQSLDALISGQEGGVHISAPAIELTTEALIETLNRPDFGGDSIAWRIMESWQSTARIRPSVDTRPSSGSGQSGWSSRRSPSVVIGSAR